MALFLIDMQMLLRGSIAKLKACGFLLNAGIAHVLVGMRDTQYVRELQALFGPASQGFKSTYGKK